MSNYKSIITVVPCLVFAGACLHVTGPGRNGVALSEDRIFVTTSRPELAEFAVHEGKLDPHGFVEIPCEAIDVEAYAERLVVLCSDGEVFSTPIDSLTSNVDAIWTAHELPSTEPEHLQRADARLSRVGAIPPPPPSDGSIRLHGPAPRTTFDTLLPSDPTWGPVDLWVGSSSWGPATANEAGDAFIFPTQLRRHWQLSLMSAVHGNALCVVSERQVGWLRDTAVDAEGRRFAAVTMSTLLVVDLGGERIAVEALELGTGKTARSELRCRR